MSLAEIPKNDAEYFAHPYLSNSDIKLVNRSINHFLWSKAHPEKTEAMIFGRALHCLVLEPNEFDKRFAINEFDSKRSKAYKEWEEMLGDVEVISRENWEHLLGMRQAMLDNPEVRNLMNIDNNFNFLGQHEVEKVHLFWYNGVGCKCKIDYESLSRDIIIDLKTCRDIEDSDDVTKLIIDYKYYQQSVFYQLGFSLDYKVQPPLFCFIFVEKEPPYGIRIRMIDKEFERIGLSKIRQGISIWKNYLSNRNNPNEYWGYNPQPSAALCPEWFKSKNNYY